MSEIECPIPCDCCGKIIALYDSHHYTDYCDCGMWQSCSHPLCDECKEHWEADDE